MLLFYRWWIFFSIGFLFLFHSRNSVAYHLDHDKGWTQTTASIPGELITRNSDKELLDIKSGTFNYRFWSVGRISAAFFAIGIIEFLVGSYLDHSTYGLCSAAAGAVCSITASLANRKPDYYFTEDGQNPFFINRSIAIDIQPAQHAILSGVMRGQNLQVGNVHQSYFPTFIDLERIGPTLEKIQISVVESGRLVTEDSIQKVPLLKLKLESCVMGFLSTVARVQNQREEIFRQRY